jgi:hypothetical protein
MMDEVCELAEVVGDGFHVEKEGMRDDPPIAASSQKQTACERETGSVPVAVMRIDPEQIGD